MQGSGGHSGEKRRNCCHRKVPRCRSLLDVSRGRNRCFTPEFRIDILRSHIPVFVKLSNPASMFSNSLAILGKNSPKMSSCAFRSPSRFAFQMHRRQWNNQFPLLDNSPPTDMAFAPYYPFTEQTSGGERTHSRPSEPNKQ